MKQLIFIFACIVFVSMNNVQGQTGFYYGYCELDSEDLNIGRARVYTDVFSSDKSTAKAEMIQQFAFYLEGKSVDLIQGKYFKKDISTWGDAATKRMEILGPFTYSQAHSKLRSSLKSSKSRDWLTLKIEGFSIQPAKPMR